MQYTHLNNFYLNNTKLNLYFFCYKSCIFLNKKYINTFASRKAKDRV